MVASTIFAASARAVCFDSGPHGPYGSAFVTETIRLLDIIKTLVLLCRLQHRRARDRLPSLHLVGVDVSQPRSRLGTIFSVTRFGRSWAWRSAASRNSSG